MRFFIKPFLAALYIAFTAALGFASYGAVRVICFPNSVAVIEGQGLRLPGNLPVSASTVIEALPVTQTGDTPVTENILPTSGEMALEAGADAQIELSFFGVPLKRVSLDVIKDTEVIPCGVTVGVWMKTDGVMVLGCGNVTSADGKSVSPCDGKLQPGDVILDLNGIKIENKRQLLETIDVSTGDITISIRRNNQPESVTVTPVISADDGKRKLGIWVRESTKGIGTLTYYNPATKQFGALGHGIMDVDTKKLMSVRTGEILESSIVAVKRGKKGAPGELVGNINEKSVIGEIVANTPRGLYGSIQNAEVLPKEAVKIALQGEVHEGPAIMISNVNGNEIKRYDVYIENVFRYSQDESKGMIIRVTDPELLTKTNGIVQGMSGSPILQDGKIIGAITHVFVQNPTKGYGIFIENMLKQGA